MRITFRPPTSSRTVSRNSIPADFDPDLHPIETFRGERPSSCTDHLGIVVALGVLVQRESARGREAGAEYRVDGGQQPD